MHFYSTISDADRDEIARAQHAHDAQQAALKAKHDAYVAEHANCTHVMMVKEVVAGEVLGAPHYLTVRCACACGFIETHVNPAKKQVVGTVWQPQQKQCDKCNWTVQMAVSRTVVVCCNVCDTKQKTYCAPHKLPKVGATVPTDRNNNPSIDR